MAGITEKSAGPQALDAIWLDEVPSQVSGPGCGVADPFGWGGASDFAAEVESVSRLFPHLDGLPSELAGDRAAGVAEQAAVCGRTSVELGAGWSTGTPGSPADPLPSAAPLAASPGDQCLMSPTDALLASPDPALGSSPSRAELSAAGDWKVATGGLSISEMVHVPAENTVADKITTIIEFVEPARAPTIQQLPAEEVFVSPTDLEIKQTPSINTSSRNISITEVSPSAAAELATAAELCAAELCAAASPVGITSPAAFETAAASGSPVVELAQSPEIEFLPAEEEDEHTRMIDQALEDLKTLESMCGITSDDTTTTSASSASLSTSLASETTAMQTAVSPVSSSPVVKTVAAVDTVKQEPVKQEPIKQEPIAQEPAQEEDDIEIVEERPAPRRRRRRPPRGPSRVAIATATPATQIVIVLNSEQLASIQKSGQIVLNAAALQPSLAAAKALTIGEKASAKAQKVQASGRAQNKARAAGKVKSRSETVVRSSTIVKGQNSVGSATIVKPAGTSISTITSAPSTSRAITTSKPGTSGVQTVARKAVKRPQVIVKQEPTKRVKRVVKPPASSSKDPLSGWMEQKVPPSGSAWDFPLLPAQALEQDLPLPADGGCIPEDLQDVLLDGTDAGAVPSLPADAAADGLFDELISGSVRLFDNEEKQAAKLEDLPPAVVDEVLPQPLLSPSQQPVLQQPQQPQPVLVAAAGAGSPQPMLLTPAPVGYNLSPQTQQLTLESWVPTLCPSPGENPVSPASECSSTELAPAPDWQPVPAARRGARRPKPYDKQPVGGRTPVRRQPMTEEERRERKKEQNKNAATRYRQKKKEEHDLVSGDQEMLEARNKVLRDRVDGLSRELNYLKQLMRDVLRHKQVTG